MSRIDVDDLVSAFKSQAVSQEAIDLLTLQVSTLLPPLVEIKSLITTLVHLETTGADFTTLCRLLEQRRRRIQSDLRLAHPSILVRLPSGVIAFKHTYLCHAILVQSTHCYNDGIRTSRNNDPSTDGPKPECFENEDVEVEHDDR